jgi:hypothetical protein
MGRSPRLLAAGVSALAISFSFGVVQSLAQTSPDPTVDADAAWKDTTPTVVVTSSQATPVYRLGDRLNTGASVFDEASIRDRAPGTGDVLQLLKLNPGVQFTTEEGHATRDTLRDLLPSEISISGGRPTENFFILDGVGVNNLMETGTSNSTLDFDWVRSASPQTIWVDADLIGSLTVLDSNVSAEFGRFGGGVVEIKTREPSRRFGMQVGYSMTSDDMARYHLSPSYTSTIVREQPRFDRRRWNVSADLPINETMGLLASYSRSQATTYNNWSANLTDIGDEQFDQTNVSESYLLKFAWEPHGDLKLTAQVTHAPYSNVIVSSSGINTLQDNHGGGTTARLGASGGRGAADWVLNLSYAMSDADKDAADWRYDVRGGLEPWCGGAITVTCTNGYVGAIKQRQNDLALDGSWSQPFRGGDLRLGFAISDVDAEKSRRDGGVYAFTGTTAVINQATGPLTFCLSATDPSCVEGRYAYNRKTVYPAYHAQVSLQTYGMWAEYVRDWRGFDVRAGLRYDYESFLGNHTLSPRLSIARELPWWGINATLGVNRYYGRSYLGYAIREKLTDTMQYSRTFTTVSGRRVWSPDWVLSSVTPTTKYSGQDLDTPYSDEVSLALTGDLFGGQWRVRGVYRDSHDQFSRSLVSTYVLIDALGASRNVNSYKMTNGGSSTYESGSLEYVLPLNRHTFSFSTNWSDTKSSASTFFDTPDDDLAGSTMVLFEGQIMSLADLYQDNQRRDFAAPFMFNADWQSKWIDNRLSITVGGRYRGDFNRIEASGAYQTVEGTRYRVYDVVQYHSSIDLNANISYALLSGDYGVTLEARIANLLDKIPDRDATYSSQPWQLGRSAWVGVRVRY